MSEVPLYAPRTSPTVGLVDDLRLVSAGVGGPLALQLAHHQTHLGEDFWLN